MRFTRQNREKYSASRAPQSPHTPLDSQVAPGSHTTQGLRAQRAASPLRAFLWRWKKVAAALLIAIFLQSIVSALASYHPGTVEIVVTKRALYTGTVLTMNDLELVSVPANLAPASKLKDPKVALGKTLNSPLPAGIPLVPEMLLDDGLRKYAPPGTVIISLPLADIAAPKMFRAGDHIFLYSLSGTKSPEDTKKAKLLTQNAVVVSIPEKNSTSLLGREIGNDNGKNILAAVPEADAAAILSAQADSPLFPVLASKKVENVLTKE